MPLRVAPTDQERHPDPMTDEEKLWHGDTTCNFCRTNTPAVFVDGKTKMGVWAAMCGSCHKRKGVGLGNGRGQKYQRKGKAPEFRYVKVEADR